MTLHLEQLDSTLVRRAVLEKRRALTPAVRAGRSHEICERFLAQAGLALHEWKGKRVALYRCVRDELDVSLLERELARLGAILHFPRVVDRVAGVLAMAEVPAGESILWSVGPFGIQEPAEVHLAIDPALLDVVFIPGVAFGLKGERVGMGAGYYDRFLPKAAKALRIALCFDFQLLAALRQTELDQPVDWIFTEQREVRLERARAWLGAR